MPTYPNIVTALGSALLAAAQASGIPVQLTEVALGDGGGAPITPEESMTALVGEVHRVPINSLIQDESDPSRLWAVVVLPPDVGGWWIREAGIMDADDNLVTVASIPETYKPQLLDGFGSELVLRLSLVLSHVSSVTLQIDPAVVLATREYVDVEVAAAVAAHDVDGGAHEDLRDAIQDAQDAMVFELDEDGDIVPAP